MSMALMVKAMSISVGNPLRKLVLIKLADNANDKGECWPSYQHIADQCEISKRSVISHIEALCNSGLLKKEVREGGVKGNFSNLYRLNLDVKPSDKIPSAGDAPPSAGDAPPSAGDAPPSAGDAPPPSAGDAPRTSHSFDPINEPVIESKEARKENEFLLPANLNLEAWDLWKRYKLEIWKMKYKPSKLGEGAAAEGLVKLSGGDSDLQMAIVKQAIAKQWKGLYALDEQKANQSKIPRQSGFTAGDKPRCSIGKI